MAKNWRNVEETTVWTLYGLGISCPQMLFVFKVLFQPSVHTGDVPQVQPLPKATPETAAKKGGEEPGLNPRISAPTTQFCKSCFALCFYPRVWGAFHLFIYLLCPSIPRKLKQTEPIHFVFYIHL